MSISQPDNSSAVRSSQQSLHPRLEAHVRRHLASQWRQPLHPPTVEAFSQLARMPGFSAGRKIVFDSGCGTGESTRQIAQALPDCTVVGIDKSVARLSRLGDVSFPYREGNAIWLRADLSSFWRLAQQAGWHLHAHFLLYPNPWPKPGQLSRRWHAHPVFPALLGLGGRLELRCNWAIYAEEFAFAIKLATGRKAQLEAQLEAQLSKSDTGAISSPFERKYRASGHELFRVFAGLDTGKL